MPPKIQLTNLSTIPNVSTQFVLHYLRSDEARSYSETLVLDPLNPQQSPIAVGYFHDPDEDVLSILSHESIPVYLNVNLPAPPVTVALVEDNPVTPPKRGRDN